jgi:hypothetical protein
MTDETSAGCAVILVGGVLSSQDFVVRLEDHGDGGRNTGENFEG